MAFSETILKLDNNAGERMYGIVHEPDRPNGTTVALFNIGLHYRTSHSRMFVRLARHLQQLGHRVVRFDPSRVGFSQGEIVVERAIDLYDDVQTGLFREDAELLLAYLRKEYNPRRLILAGLCGGALTATITAASDMNVDGVVFIAGPVTVTSPEAELSTLHIFEADQLLLMYRRRAFNPKAWFRFLTGQSDYGDLFRSIRTKLTDLLSRLRPGGGGDAENVSEAAGSENTGERLNRVFLVALDRLLTSEKRFLFVMPELDRATYDFDRLYARTFKRKYTDRRHLYDIIRIPKANHTFSSPESSAQLFDTIAEWVREKGDE